MEKNYQQIPGWAADADPENEPNYPMKKYTGDDHVRLNWNRPVLQDVHTEILKSKEIPRMPAVFGSTVPPSGLSGVMRRKAFKFGESAYGHWLNLLLADRINVIEGIIGDLKKGHIPNIFAERGMKADWKYNRKELLTKIALIGGLAAVTLFYFSSNKKSAGKQAFKY